MGNITLMAVFIVALNLFMFFGQTAMIDVNPAGTRCYDVSGSIIGNKLQGVDNSTLPDTDVMADLPASTGQVSSSGNIFTDTFTWILNWIKSLPGINIMVGIVEAPYNILKCTGLPNIFVAGIGIIWYLVSFIVFISWIFGRTD